MTHIHADEAVLEDRLREVSLKGVIKAGNVIMFSHEETGMILTVNASYYSVWRRSLNNPNKFIAQISWDTESRLKDPEFFENSFGDIYAAGRTAFDELIRDYEEWEEENYGEEE